MYICIYIEGFDNSIYTLLCVWVKVDLYYFFVVRSVYISLVNKIIKNIFFLRLFIVLLYKFNLIRVCFIKKCFFIIDRLRFKVFL